MEVWQPVNVRTENNEFNLVGYRLGRTNHGSKNASAGRQYLLFGALFAGAVAAIVSALFLCSGTTGHGPGDNKPQAALSTTYVSEAAYAGCHSNGAAEWSQS
jgi:hypothetical protein